MSDSPWNKVWPLQWKEHVEKRLLNIEKRLDYIEQRQNPKTFQEGWNGIKTDTEDGGVKRLDSGDDSLKSW